MKKWSFSVLAVVLIALGAFAAHAGDQIQTVEENGILTSTLDGRTLNSRHVQVNAVPPAFEMPPDMLAGGTVCTIDVFAGEHNEGLNSPFEEWTTGSPGRAFGDTADFWSNYFIKGTGGWTFGCYIGPMEGNGIGGSADGVTYIVFDTPTQRFGGYFGTNMPATYPVDATIQFYDDLGELITTLPMDVPQDCTWNWQGWEVEGNSFKEIRMDSGQFGGSFIQMDGLTASEQPGEGCGTTGGDCDLTPVLEAIEILEAKADAIEVKLDAIEPVNACEIINLLVGVVPGAKVPTTHPCYEAP